MRLRGHMRWGVARELPHESPTIVAEPCRTCGVEIPRGAPSLHVDWEAGIAHVACGWKLGPGLASTTTSPAPATLPSCNKCGEDVADAAALTTTAAGFKYCENCMRKAMAR